MNIKSIGENAGIVWRLLDNNRKWEYNELREASGLSDRDLNTAIGWLARENKIEFQVDGQNNNEYIYLEINQFIG